MLVTLMSNLVTLMSNLSYVYPKRLLATSCTSIMKGEMLVIIEIRSSPQGIIAPIGTYIEQFVTLINCTYM